MLPSALVTDTRTLLLSPLPETVRIGVEANAKDTGINSATRTPRMYFFVMVLLLWMSKVDNRCIWFVYIVLVSYEDRRVRPLCFL